MVHVISFEIVWFRDTIRSSIVSLSTIGIECVVATFIDIEWIKQHLLDYNLKLDCISIKCYNTIAISLTENLVLHSWTKTIEIRHHFLRDHVEKRDFVFEYIDTKI